MRGVAGAHFTFDWNIASASPTRCRCTPVTRYVDMIGADNYDTSWAFPSTDHVSSWNHILTRAGD